MSIRRALRNRPVNSLKHVIDIRSTVIAAVPVLTDVAIQNDSPSTAAVNQVHIGSSIKAIFLKVELVGTVPYGGNGVVYMVVYKNPGNQVPAPIVDTVGVSPRRKFVIHQEMTMVGIRSTAGAGGGDAVFPRTMFKGVILLPKRYQRFGDDDRLVVVLGNASAEATGRSDVCLQCIYKEYF